VQSLIALYVCTYVRTIVEYASVVWSTHNDNVELLKSVESVQRRFTKRLPGCGQLSYSGRLAKLKMDSLELRSLKADLTYAYKILFGLIYVSCADMFLVCNSKTRGHNMKLSVQYSRIDVRKFFFSNRVVQPWNSLKVQPADFSSVRCFNRF